MTITSGGSGGPVSQVSRSPVPARLMGPDQGHVNSAAVSGRLSARHRCRRVRAGAYEGNAAATFHEQAKMETVRYAAYSCSRARNARSVPNNMPIRSRNH